MGVVVKMLLCRVVNGCCSEDVVDGCCSKDVVVVCC